MGLLRLFPLHPAQRWDLVGKKGKRVLHAFGRYVETYLHKIDALQVIILKIFDFNNWHFFEREEVRYAASGYAHSTSPKLYNHYFKLIKRRLVAIARSVGDGLANLRGTKKKILLLQQELENMPPQNDVQDQLQNITMLAERLAAAEQGMVTQSAVIERIINQFTRFVGNEKRWEHDYAANIREYKGVALYGSIIREKERVFQEWKEFIAGLQQYIPLVQQEAATVLGLQLTSDIANWKVTVSSALSTSPALRGLRNILKTTTKVQALMQEDMLDVYHATESRGSLLPLRESLFSRGFFVCTGSSVYARKIKSDQSVDAGSFVRVVTLRMPVSVFRTLFIKDQQMGKPGDELSLAAYEHAYFLPVSRYPYINYYFNELLIEVK